MTSQQLHAQKQRANYLIFRENLLIQNENRCLSLHYPRGGLTLVLPKCKHSGKHCHYFDVHFVWTFSWFSIVIFFPLIFLLPTVFLKKLKNFLWLKIFCKVWVAQFFKGNYNTVKCLLSQCFYTTGFSVEGFQRRSSISRGIFPNVTLWSHIDSYELKWHFPSTVK